MKTAWLRLIVALAVGAFCCRADTSPPKPELKKTVIASGTIEKIDTKARTVTVRLVLTSKTFKVAPDCEFVLGKKEKATLESLKVGNNVSLNYEEEKETLTAHRIVRKGVGPDKEAARERERLEHILTPTPSEQRTP